jgi:hypothetical protein
MRDYDADLWRVGRECAARDGRVGAVSLDFTFEISGGASLLKQPLAEIFGFPVDNGSSEAERYRQNRLCPYNNKVPNCTKDSVTNPLGICSIFHGEELAITCPVRLRQDWMIAEHAASFFFPSGTKWTTLLEVRLRDKQGRSAGNIDVVLVSYDESEKITNFGALHIQAASISEQTSGSVWNNLNPQIFLKGAIFRAWGKKQAIAVQRSFYETLPAMPSTEPRNADTAWLIYDFCYDPQKRKYAIKQSEVIYSRFDSVLYSLAPRDIQLPVSYSEQHFVENLCAQMVGVVVD